MGPCGRGTTVVTAIIPHARCGGTTVPVRGSPGRGGPAAGTGTTTTGARTITAIGWIGSLQADNFPSQRIRLNNDLDSLVGKAKLLQVGRALRKDGLGSVLKGRIRAGVGSANAVKPVFDARDNGAVTVKDRLSGSGVEALPCRRVRRNKSLHSGPTAWRQKTKCRRSQGGNGDALSRSNRGGGAQGNQRC